MKRFFSIDVYLRNFFICFLCWLSLLQICVIVIHSTPELSTSIETAIAELTRLTYSLIFEPIIRENNHIIHISSNRYLVVDHQCTALALCATLTAALLALPHKWTIRIAAAVIAVLLIQIENIIRIVFLMYEIKSPINNFDFYHLYIWQFINFCFALLVFYLCFKYTNHYENNNKILKTI